VRRAKDPAPRTPAPPVPLLQAEITIGWN